MMNLVMSGLTFVTCLVYLDDIIVFAKDLDTHLERLIQVLQRLASVNLKLKPSKCHLLQKSVLFLGHVVIGNGLATALDKILAVKSWPTPTKLREVRAFLRLCSYYRKFVPEFAQIGRPLHALTKKRVQFYGTPEREDAFQELKRRLTVAPILVLPSNEGCYVLDTDASGGAIGAVLSHFQDDKERRMTRNDRVLWLSRIMKSQSENCWLLCIFLKFSDRTC